MERDARRIQEEAQRLISENEELLRAAQGPDSVHFEMLVKMITKNPI